jgi:hypothetical protein
MGFEPEAVSNPKLQLRVPYQDYTRRLEDGVQQGVLSPEGDGSYRLTGRGREVAQKVILAAYARMGSLNPLPASELLYLSTLLWRLVEACLEATQPPGKWAIQHSRRFDPGQKAPLLIKVDQYLSDLASYRDDAHLAAWRPLGFLGPIWEALTVIWRGELGSLEALQDKLRHRGHDPDVYAQAVEELVEREFIRRRDGKIQVTPQGEQLRQEAEEATDRYFYTPWNCLDGEELEALHQLLVELAQGLRKPQMVAQ